MIKLRTMIVDDEQLARRLLRANLQDIATVEVVAECENGRQALQAILEHSPDLIFMDIQMPGMNGFEVAKTLQADIMPMIIFTTAYDQYALAAFNVNAVDYILKPLEEALVKRAVQRAVEHYSSKIALRDVKQHLLEALEQIDYTSASIVKAEQSIQTTMPTPSQFSEKLFIKDGGSTTLVSMQDIDWIDAAGDYMCVHLHGVTHVMRSTMKDLVDQLDPNIFKRIHRSTILNMAKIERATALSKGEFFVYLSCGEQLKVSRSYGSVIKQYLTSTSS
jgi:two-component system LytT family response regulator